MALLGAKPPPNQELEAFRAALEATPFQDAALSAAVAKFCAEKKPLDPTDLPTCKARLTEAIALAKIALNPPVPAALAAPAQPAVLGRDGLKALKKCELTARRLRDDWAENLTAQMEEIMLMITEALKEMSVNEMEDKAKGQIYHSFFDEELALFARFIETLIEEWSVTIERMLQEQLETELGTHLSFLEQTTGEVPLPHLSLSLRSKQWQATAEVRLKEQDLLGNANAGFIGQMGMLAMMALGPAGIAAKVGIGAMTLAYGFFSTKKKKEKEQEAQRAKAHEDLSKQLVDLTRQRIDDARKGLQRRVQVYLQEVLDALTEYKEDHTASPMMAMQRPAPPPQRALAGASAHAQEPLAPLPGDLPPDPRSPLLNDHEPRERASRWRGARGAKGLPGAPEACAPRDGQRFPARGTWAVVVGAFVAVAVAVAVAACRSCRGRRRSSWAST
jgi:hypothetical protein